MASEKDLEANLQHIFQMQMDAGLAPGVPLSETLDHLLRPIFQLDDGATPGQSPSHASQQGDPSTVHVLEEIMLSLSQVRPVPLEPFPLGQSVPHTMPEDANQVHPLPPSVTPASSTYQVAQLDTPLGASPLCPVCGQSFGRRQERARHVQTHLPYWLFCPFLGCPWRGDRSYTLSQHWTARHADFGESPKPEDCKIYNPDPLVQSVVNGELLIGEVTEIALQAVNIRAQELDKVGIWEDEWGRGQRGRYSVSRDI